MENNIPDNIQLVLANDILYANICDEDCRKLLKELFTNNRPGFGIDSNDLSDERSEELLSTIVRIGNKYKGII